MRYFFVGIKGAGVASIATLYREWGRDVFGSDTEEEFFTDHILRELKIPIVSFDPAVITKDVAEVIYSSAYRADHPQLARARELGIPLRTYSAVLAEIFNKRRGVLVTGTHGKTTSSAMLGRVLEDAGFDPTVVVGGSVIEWGRSARAGASEWIVAEGDEYQAKILMLRPHLVLLTNIEYDHPDFYSTEEDYRNVFRTLVGSLPDSAYVVAHESLRDFVMGATKAHTIFFGGERDCKLLASLTLRVWGEHNKMNALGVLYASEALGAKRADVIRTLSHFRGTKRRMELFTSEDAETVIMDDYAHHPTEIRATLSALREHYPHRSIVAIFQPHTYSRTRALLDTFAVSFNDATHVILLDIYSSARETEQSIRGEDVYAAVDNNHASVIYAPTLDAAYEVALTFLQEKPVIVTLGAGDVWRIAKRLFIQEESG